MSIKSALDFVITLMKQERCELKEMVVSLDTYKRLMLEISAIQQVPDNHLREGLWFRDVKITRAKEQAE